MEMDHSEASISKGFKAEMQWMNEAGWDEVAGGLAQRLNLQGENSLTGCV